MGNMVYRWEVGVEVWVTWCTGGRLGWKWKVYRWEVGNMVYRWEVGVEVWVTWCTGGRLGWKYG